MGRAERDWLWRARHQTYEILVRSHPGKSFLIVDIAVPISSYPNLVTEVEKILVERDLGNYLLGHAGDGNLHSLIPYHSGDRDSFNLALEADEEIVETAIRLGGTVSGEHGIGIGKMRFMDKEHGLSLNVMRDIKQTLDSKDILNPGKIFDMNVH